MPRPGAILLAVTLFCGAVGCKDDDTSTEPADDDTTAEPETPPYDDADGDGVPDLRDLCPETAAGSLHDARGCSSSQVSGCSVTLEAPEDGATISATTVTFRFAGDCEGYRLYASDSMAFPAHRRQLLAEMIPPGDVEVDTSDLPSPGADGVVYWAVEGSAMGHVFLSASRSLQLP